LVRESYNVYENAKIPNGWKMVSIFKLSKDMSDGPFGSNLKKEHYTENKEARIIQLSNIGENGWNDDNIKYTTFVHAKTIARCIVNSGNIVVAKMMPAGRAIICPNDEKMYILGSDSIKIVLDNSLVDTTYFMYATKSRHFQDQVKEDTQGSTRARTSISKLRKNSIFIPPITEQQKIAMALSDMDNLIFSLEKLIEKKKAIKQGAMQELLTGKKRLPGFGGEWKTISIGDIFAIYKGNGLSKEKLSYTGKHNCILYGELFTTYKEIIKKIYSKTDYSEGMLSRKGDVLLPGSTTTTGNDLAKASVILSNNVMLGGDIIVLRPLVDIDSRIFGYLIPLIAKKILQYTQGITIIHLQANALHKMSIYMPVEVEEQKAIADILFDMDAEINLLEQKLEKCQKLKQGMMQQLLTGKIRLISNDDTVAEKPEVNTLKVSSKGQ